MWAYANFPAYFRKIRSLLRDQRGLLLNHAIARYAARPTAVKALTHLTPEKRLMLKYIFPRLGAGSHRP